MKVQGSFIHATFLNPNHAQITEEVDGEHVFANPPIPIDTNLIARLEEKYIFPDGAADYAREQLKNRQFLSILVYLREK
jgi:hypothetical protein